jgi:glycogen operon protein
VDGFRFDLASVLGRPRGGAFDPDAPLLTAITTDPLLCRRKLIAEPWDATGDGYRAGGFGPQWAEWNDRFRDGVREFWRGATGVRDVAYRLSGSSDLYSHNRRRPWASINFVAAHDGFTVRDLVSREESGDPARDARNLLGTLLLAMGTPMLMAGDEMWRTQGGEHNAYDRDDETSWVDWTASATSADLLTFTRAVAAIRAGSPALRQPHFFDGRPAGDGEADVVWFGANGVPLEADDWFDDDRRLLGMWIDGSRCVSRTRAGEMLADRSWLILAHAGTAQLDVVLPQAEFGPAFEPVLTTHTPDGKPDEPAILPAGATVTMPGRTILLLRAVDGGPA